MKLLLGEGLLCTHSAFADDDRNKVLAIVHAFSNNVNNVVIEEDSEKKKTGTSSDWDNLEFVESKKKTGTSSDFNDLKFVETKDKTGTVVPKFGEDKE